MLVAAKTPQEFFLKKILNMSSSSFSQDDGGTKSDDSSTNYLLDNRDDCDGILPLIQKIKIIKLSLHRR